MDLTAFVAAGGPQATWSRGYGGSLGVRVLGVVLSTAFEGRIERVNERVNDYKRLLERRKATPPPEPKQGYEVRPRATQVAAAGFRTGAASGS